MTTTPVRVSAAERILDLLDIDGGSFTFRQLVTEFDHRWPGVSPSTIKRAASRLTADGKVAACFVEECGYTARHGMDATRIVRSISAKKERP